MEGTIEAIQGSIEQKAFQIEKKRETDRLKAGIKPEIENVSEVIDKAIQEKAFRREKQREEDKKLSVVA